MESLENIKRKFGIIGHDEALDRALNIAVQVAATDLSVLITGESGVGKDNFSKIIHQNSIYKHGEYIAVNCGAIPEGTIDSELFGHEKGAFTGALDSRKGYFEVANNGTIFLDEIAEMPLGTQARLLRVLENGEFIRVGSSKVQKTKVRVIAATNVNLQDRIAAGKFRADLYYRLNNVPIYVPALRERKEDIVLLFTKFATDFAEKYRTPLLQLTPEAMEMLKNYRWPGNVRELRNITQQISTLETERLISADILVKYLNHHDISNLPVKIHTETADEPRDHFERELIYKFLIDMKREVAELKNMVNHLATEQPVKPLKTVELSELNTETPSDIEFQEITNLEKESATDFHEIPSTSTLSHTQNKDSFSLINSEKEMIRKCLEKHRNNRKAAADELGISERTLYRKIKSFDL